MRSIFCLLTGFVLLLGLSGCNRGMGLDQMKNRFEDMGQTVAQVRHCGNPVDEAAIRSTLQTYARRNGAEAQEQASLLGYYDTAIDLEARTQQSGSSCTTDDRTRNSALLNDKLNGFK
jgi:hypothetical protein